jgi:hypothetical protein
VVLELFRQVQMLLVQLEVLVALVAAEVAVVEVTPQKQAAMVALVQSFFITRRNYDNQI